MKDNKMSNLGKVSVGILGLAALGAVFYGGVKLYKEIKETYDALCDYGDEFDDEMDFKDF